MHTPEPWLISLRHEIQLAHDPDDRTGPIYAYDLYPSTALDAPTIGYIVDGFDTDGKANAQRIADCVNACDGMENPAAEIANLRNIHHFYYNIGEMLADEPGDARDPEEKVRLLLEEVKRLREIEDMYKQLLSEAAYVFWLWHAEYHHGTFPVDLLGEAIIDLSVTNEALAEWEGENENDE